MIIKHLIPVSALLIGAIHGSSQSTFVPEKTKVLIIPAINSTNEKDEAHKKAEVEQSGKRLSELFSERRFQVISEADASKSLSELKIDWSDHEQWTKANLKAAGTAASADLVVFTAITDSTQRMSSGFMGGNVARVKMSLWLYDVAGARAIYDAKAITGESKGGLAGAIKTASHPRRIAGVRIALDNALVKDKGGFLSNFPNK